MKLLLYCTKANKCERLVRDEHYGKPFYLCGAITENFESLNGKIVAECDFEVEEIIAQEYRDYYCTSINHLGDSELQKRSCLTLSQLCDYLGTKEYGSYELEEKVGYAIHIKNLKIFDEPRELRFYYQKYKGDRHLYNIEKAPQNMMRAIGKQGNVYSLISIRPEWLCKILNGEKTIEVRKKVLKEMLK